MTNKITRKGRQIYLNGKHTATLHASEGYWTYSIIGEDFRLKVGYVSFMAAVKDARNFITMFDVCLKG